MPKPLLCKLGWHDYVITDFKDGPETMYQYLDKRVCLRCRKIDDQITKYQNLILEEDRRLELAKQIVKEEESNA